MSEKLPAKQRETINLDEAIIVRGKNNEIRRIKTKCHLNEADGTMVQVIPAKRAYGNFPARPAVYTPSASGFKAMSAKVGLAFDYPKTIIVDGVEQPNGYKDKEGTYYFVTKVGGYTANGQPVIVQRLVDYNVRRYNMQDLLAKAKQKENKQYFKVTPFRGKDQHGQLLGAPDGGNYAGYQVDDSVVLWVNCDAPEFVNWLGEMNNRIKNAVRTCQTFSERNAIAAHPAMPPQRKFAVRESTVECTAWVATKGSINMSELEGSSDVQIDDAHVSLTADAEGEVVAEAAAAETFDKTDATDIEAHEDRMNQDAPPDDDDDLPYTDGADLPPPAAKGTKPEVADEPDPAKEGLIKNLLELKKVRVKTFKTLCEKMDITDLNETDVQTLLELERLLKMSMNTTGK